MSFKSAIAGYASQLREEMGIPEHEAVGDLLLHIKEAGYHYMEESFGLDFSAFTRPVRGGTYLIGFNRDQFWSDKFRRFTLSHELGHITIPEHRRLLEQGGLPRSRSEFMSRDEIERQADYFAICFLAPMKVFLSAMKSKEFTAGTISGLSDQFGISTYAAVLRFVELTKLSCALIVCNKDGTIRYEKRSDRMKETYKQGFLQDKAVRETTLTSDYIKGKQSAESCTVSLREWYEDLPNGVDVDATESVIDLRYNGTLLTLLVPHVANLDECLEEDVC